MMECASRSNSHLYTKGVPIHVRFLSTLTSISISLSMWCGGVRAMASTSSVFLMVLSMWCGGVRAMASTSSVFLMVFLVILCGAYAQPAAPAPAPAGSTAGAPAPSLDCFNNLLNMSDCLTYVELGSNLTAPDKGCCPSLAGLVESSPICLCQLLGSSNSFGVKLDVSKALNLPKVCRVTTPPVSLCSAVGVPVSVPTASEGPTMPGRSPAGGMTPSLAPELNGTPTNGAPSINHFSLVIFVSLSSAVGAILLRV